MDYSKDQEVMVKRLTDEANLTTEIATAILNQAFWDYDEAFKMTKNRNKKVKVDNWTDNYEPMSMFR